VNRGENQITGNIVDFRTRETIAVFCHIFEVGRESK
jgi:hypothetical protein